MFDKYNHNEIEWGFHQANRWVRRRRRRRSGLLHAPLILARPHLVVCHFIQSEWTATEKCRPLQTIKEIKSSAIGGPNKEPFHFVHCPYFRNPLFGISPLHSPLLSPLSLVFCGIVSRLLLCCCSFYPDYIYHHHLHILLYNWWLAWITSHIVVDVDEETETDLAMEHKYPRVSKSKSPESWRSKSTDRKVSSKHAVVVVL